jgi:hypothetical protein
LQEESRTATEVAPYSSEDGIANGVKGFKFTNGLPAKVGSKNKITATVHSKLKFKMQESETDAC